MNVSLTSRLQVEAQVFNCLLAEECVVVMVLAFRDVGFDVNVDRVDALLESSYSGYTSVITPGWQVYAHGQATFVYAPFGYIIQTVTAHYDLNVYGDGHCTGGGGTG